MATRSRSNSARAVAPSYSADEGGSTISAIDLGTGAVSSVPNPVAPHNVDLTSDGCFLLAVGTPASGNHGSGGHGHDGDAAGVLVILDPLQGIQTGAYPHGLRLSLDGAELYVANVEDGSVSVIDTATLPRSPVSWSVPHPFRSASRLGLSGLCLPA